MPVNQSQVTKILDLMPLGLDRVPQSKREEAQREVIDFLLDAILEDTSKQVSAVSGRVWKSLSKEYKAKKASESSSNVANLELTGAMLDALEGVIKGSGKIEVGIFDGGEAPKAFNHNTGDTLPKRQFIPGPRQAFRPGIMEEIEDILYEYAEKESAGEELPGPQVTETPTTPPSPPPGANPFLFGEDDV